jgi:trigger factor
MQVTETKNEGLKREFKIVVPAGDIDGQVNTRLEELKRTVRIPGFRPGKAPVSLMKKKFGPAVMGEVLEKAVGEATQKTLADRGIRPATQPKVEVNSFAEGTDLEYTLSVEALPEIELQDFHALELERMVAEPEESEIQSALERLANANKTSEPVSEDRPSQKGDILLIDFVGKIDGEAFPGGKAESYELELGTGTFIPGFEDQLTGVKAGAHVDVKVKFPEEYGAQELAGKDAVFEVDVKEIRQGKPAAIDDELAKKVGAENLEGLKKNIREEHERELKSLSRLRLKRKLLDALAEHYTFPVPEAMTEAETNAIWHQFEEQRKAGRLDMSEYEGKSDDEIKADLRGIAERRVRLALVLAEVGRTNDIQLGRDELNRALANEARRYPGHEKEVVEYYRKTPQALESLRGPLIEDKVVDFVIELAKVAEKKVTVAELLKDPDEEAAEEKPAESKPRKRSRKTAEKDEGAGA